jgi:tol-pal system protein YbgF
LQKEVDTKLQPLAARIDGKADTKALLKLSEEIDKLRQDLAGLRGQLEVVSNDIANTQRRQKDFYTDLDQRIGALDQKYAAVETRQQALENKQSTLDSKPATPTKAGDSSTAIAPPDADERLSEQKTYDLALGHFKSENYRAAAQGFTDFLKRFPDSSNLAQAYFWLGSSHYALQDCVSAIPAFQTVVSRFTNSQRAPDAMLSLAECQRDLKDKAAARQTINNLIKRFPTSPAAKTGKELLSELK